MNEGEEMLDQPIPAHHHALVFVQPGEQPFNLPAAPVSPENALVLGCGSAPVSAMRGDQRNALRRKALIEWITVVGTIPDKSFGLSQRDGLSEGSFDKGDLMWRSRSRVHGEWKTRSVCNNHELRTLAPLGLSHCAAPFFATTKVPSIKHSERLIFPRCSKSRANASKIACNTPWRIQRLKRRKQVDPEGKRSGRSAHAAPVRNTHRTPFITARSLCTTGRPRPSARGSGLGISDSRIAHCSSVSSSRLPMHKNVPMGSRKVQNYL
jgi:hypothetical protein